MTVKDAVAKRFEQLCDQRGIRPNELATRAGVTPSTVYSMLDPSRQRVSIATIKKLCDGLDITLGQFFSCALFDELEQREPIAHRTICSAFPATHTLFSK